MKMFTKFSIKLSRNKLLVLFSAVVFLGYIYLYSNLNTFNEYGDQYQRINHINKINNAQRAFRVLNSSSNIKWFFDSNISINTIRYVVYIYITLF